MLKSIEKENHYVKSFK